MWRIFGKKGKGSTFGTDTLRNEAPRYRLGKKQKRAILEVATGHEYLVFPQNNTKHVEEFMNWLNKQPHPQPPTKEEWKYINEQIKLKKMNDLTKITSYMSIPKNDGTEILGRQVMHELTFNEPGPFNSYYAATGWLSDKGYSYGSMSAPLQFIGVLRGDVQIAKWKNLTNKERGQFDAVIMSNDWRGGECKIIFFIP